MRESLKELIKQTIVFEYNLPNEDKKIPKTIISTNEDKCYSARDIESFKEIIYNSIIEYSFNEFELNDKDYQKLFGQALKSKIKIPFRTAAFSLSMTIITAGMPVP